jgi:hypothetical protein
MMRAGTLPDTLKRWELKRPGGLGLSPLAVVGHIEFGTVNKFIHIWPYPSLDARMMAQKKAGAEGLWPPGSGNNLLMQTTKTSYPRPSRQCSGGVSEHRGRVSARCTNCPPVFTYVNTSLDIGGTCQSCLGLSKYLR